MDQPDLSADLEEMLEHLKWNLWHGKVDRALELLDELAYALDVDDGSPEHRKLLKAVRAFEGYIAANRALIPNYGERYRQGKIIATAFVESAVNQVVRRRFVKKTADAVDSSGRPPSLANPDTGAESKKVEQTAGWFRGRRLPTGPGGGTVGTAVEILASKRPSSTAAGIWTSRWAPRRLQRIGCFLGMRRPIIRLTRSKLHATAAGAVAFARDAR